MAIRKQEVIDLVLIGTGLSGLNFIDTFLKKKRKIHVISPNLKENINKKKYINALPSQMHGKDFLVENYFNSNQLIVDQGCKVLGSLEKGGLSNYWGLQIDSYLNQDQKNLKKKTITSLQNSFIEV